MKKRNNVTTRYYKSFNDDFVVSANQNYQLSADYQWIKEGLGQELVSRLLYGLVWLYAFFYCRIYMQIKIKNRSCLQQTAKAGLFIYANHTLEVGDAFLPLHVCLRKRVYIVVSPANLGIPGLGRFLPYMGALPLPNSMAQMKKFIIAVKRRIRQRACIVIYPEGHVWPYYTKIRPFPATSFKYPLISQAPVYCLTTIYSKRRFRKKPKITTFLDGPFEPDAKLTIKQQAEDLRNQVHACMLRRSARSTYEFIHYKKQEGML